MDDLPPGMVGVPCVRWMWTRSVLGLLRLQESLPQGSMLSFEPGGSTIASKRNALCEQMLEEPRFEWIFMADSDMAFSPETVPQLLSLNADLATALTVMREAPHRICAGFVVEEGKPPEDPRRAAEAEGLETGFLNPEVVARKRRQPVEVDFSGAAALLIHRHVLEEMEPPWFVADDAGLSEDTNFTIRCTQAGHRLVLHTGIEVGHVSDRAYALEDAVRCQQREKRDADARRRESRVAAAQARRDGQ